MHGMRQTIVRETSLRIQCLHQDAACVISDIVKRRSIRAWIAKHIARYVLRILALSPGRSFRSIARWFAMASGVARRPVLLPCVTASLLVKLDRLTIGSILRSKLVFLIISSCMQHSSRVRAVDLRIFSKCAVQHSAECVDIDNESNQVP